MLGPLAKRQPVAAAADLVTNEVTKCQIQTSWEQLAGPSDRNDISNCSHFTQLADFAQHFHRQLPQANHSDRSTIGPADRKASDKKNQLVSDV